MSLIDRAVASFQLGEAATRHDPTQAALVTELSEALRETQENNLLLQESLADAELALEDIGWHRLTAAADQEFTRAGIQRAARVCRVMIVVNPLMKRGVAVRVGYIWGGGVSIQAPATGEVDGQQDVNSVLQEFLDDESNQRAFTGPQAREEAERGLASDGQVCLAMFTNPRTGRVQVRSVPFDEVEEVIFNPGDRDDPWYYKRIWTQTVVDIDTATTRQQTFTTYYPALGYYPRVRPRTIDGHEVQWDSPLLHVRVNALDGWTWGVPDAYSAVFWARGYKEFLEDWAKLVKALARFAFQYKSKNPRTRKVQDQVAAALRTDSVTGKDLEAGATALPGPYGQLEAIPKTGAVIDADSGKPLAAMVAAGLEVPVTMLLGDPGITGARAVAETLNEPTRNTMQLRRELWSWVIQRIGQYVIDQAVIAPQGKLKGRITRDADDRRVVELAGDKDGSHRTIQVTWPDWDNVPVDVLVNAIAAADATGKVHPLQTARLLYEALGVDDVDEALKELMDADGNFVDPRVTAGQAAIDAHRRGDDPASALNGPDEDDPPDDQPPEDDPA